MSELSLDRLLDHHAIAQTVFRVARGIDRCDRATLASCFWPDATDDHGIFKGTAKDFLDWVLDLLPVAFERTQHLNGNLIVEFEGETAFAETYFVAYHRIVRDGAPRDMMAAGRYLDRFERRNGEWRIAHRHAVYDWSKDEPASDDAWRQAPTVDQLERGRRDREDRVFRGKPPIDA